MLKDKIGFAGKGWGAVAAVKSLKQFYNLECLSTDGNVIDLLSDQSNSVNSFDEFTCNLIICAGYEPLIEEKLLSRYKIINIHYSLLPAYRGWHSTAWAIMNGENKLGLSIFEMNQFMDDGAIIHQKEFVNDNTSSATHYMGLMNNYIEDNLGKIIKKYSNGEITPKPQDKSKASWVGKRNQTHNLINFNNSFEHCKRLFRVLQFPYPKPQIEYKKEIYTVQKVKYHKCSINTDIARILNIDNEGIWIKAQDGYIIVNDIEDINNNTINNNTFKIGTYVNDNCKKIY